MNDGNLKMLQYALGYKTQRMVDEYVSIHGKDFNNEYNDLTPLSKQKDKLEEKKRIHVR